MERMNNDEFGLAIATLIILQVKHFAFDYLFQNSYQLNNKGIYGHPGGVLHAVFHAAGTGLAVLVFHPWALVSAAIVVADFLLHYHIDWVHKNVQEMLKRSGSEKGSYVALGLDQMTHQIFYLGVAFALVVFGPPVGS